MPPPIASPCVQARRAGRRSAQGHAAGAAEARFRAETISSAEGVFWWAGAQVLLRAIHGEDATNRFVLAIAAALVVATTQLMAMIAEQVKISSAWNNPKGQANQLHRHA
jgi:hypothetical protein